ncbi:PDZ and LIM domain protein 3 isoform X2 [Zootermopsis nevadensis]|uniref:PDZ and LIM domain protein 3 isoform X2 n=1 Tax=Zootermopsis nevadensis TaxID=136037 RepID=UPI000B8E5130|nr:PDZ and LIM domain protein 3 isoform X2 [Zootermopsis nevadensis]
MSAVGGGGKPHVFGVTLRRSSRNTPWGVRIVGGVDVGSSIVIIRAQDGTPAGAELRRGDIIKKIVDYDSRDLRHEDAQNLFRNAGNTISLVIERESNAAGIRPVAATPVKPPVAGGVPTPFNSASFYTADSPKPFVNSSAPTLGSPIPGSKSLNRAPSPIVFPPPLPSSQEFSFQQNAKPHVQFRPVETSAFDEHEEELSSITNQPYRTTPLVLPGAKVKKDATLTSSYLRHHPNPMFRAPPSHHDTTAEVLMKQKVADTVLQRVAGEDAMAGKQVVHKQFNSPIGLYSDHNITETIQSQTGITPNNARVGTSTLNPRNQSKVSLRKTLSYDPAKSETFKALQEAELGDTVQEVTVPAQTRVFSPSAQLKKAAGGTTYTINSIGNSDEYIHQSGSFKRLMNQVLGESEY